MKALFSIRRSAILDPPACDPPIPDPPIPDPSAADPDRPILRSEIPLQAIRIFCRLAGPAVLPYSDYVIKTERLNVFEITLIDGMWHACWDGLSYYHHTNLKALVAFLEGR